MSGQIDVLTEFRTMRKRFVNCAVHNGSDREFAEGACESFDAAISAVAELIEAHREAVEFIGRLPGTYNPPAGAYQRWRAALAHVQGAAA